MGRRPPASRLGIRSHRQRLAAPDASPEPVQNPARLASRALHLGEHLVQRDVADLGVGVTVGVAVRGPVRRRGGSERCGRSVRGFMTLGGGVVGRGEGLEEASRNGDS